MRILRSTWFWVVLGLLIIGESVSLYRSQFGVARAELSSTPSGQRDSGTNHLESQDVIIAEGRVTAYHGSQITVSAEISGLIQSLMIDEKDAVAKGDVIAEIKVDDLRAALKEAKARIAEIDAEIRLAELDLKRNEKLWKESTISEQELDKAHHDFDLFTAQRTTAEATVQKIDATIAKASIRSPIDGVVTARFANPGEIAEVGTKLVTIADMNRIRVEAEVDEYDSGKVRLGQAVVITAEGYPGQSWQARVEEIPDVVTEKNLKPIDPSRPTDARVLRVKVAFKEKTPLKLGQRVEIEILPSQTRSDTANATQ